MIGRNARIVPVSAFSSLILALALGAGPAGGGSGEVAQQQVPPPMKPEKDAEVIGPKAASSTSGLEKVWTVEGSYSGVTTPPGGRLVYAIAREQRCDVLDPAGATLSTFPFVASSSRARVARLFDGTEGLIGFRLWDKSFFAARSGGEKLWEQPGGQGVNDVWTADLDGDGLDEVIVGFNGNTGVHAYSSRGAPLWQQSSIGNVWHVAAGDVDGDGRRVVLTTSAQGKIHLFDPGDGHALRTINPGLYASMVRTAPAKIIPAAKGDVILAVGMAPFGTSIVALSGAGRMHWRLRLKPGFDHCEELIVSPDGAWAASSFQKGTYNVVDVASGKVLAEGSEPGGVQSLAWCTPADGGKPLLVTVSKAGVAAFKVDPTAKPTP